MRVPVSAVVYLLSALSCVRAIREERREQAIDTGQRVPFSAESARRWDFGDGSPPREGQVVEHAFAKAGRYVVRAFEKDRVTDRVSVLVQPRDVFRAVAPGAEAVLVFRTLDEVAPAIDFAERLGSAALAQQLIDRSPILHFILEPGAAGAAALDRAEGAGAYLPAGASALVTFVGVVDDDAALRTFREFLVDHGWRPDGPAGFVTAELHAQVLVDRGTLYFVTSSTAERTAGAVKAVQDAPTRGIETEAAMASALAQLASGGVAVVARRELTARTSGAMKGGAWSIALGALRLGRDEGRLVGNLIAERPLWQTPPASRPARLLSHAPEGLIAALSMDVPLAEVLDAFGLSRPEDADDDELRAGLAVLSRRLDLTLSFDVEAFLSATILGGGLPAPRVTLLGETLVPDRIAVRAVLDRVLARRRAPYEQATEKGVTVWRTRLEQQALELALDPDTLFVRWGRPLAGTEPVDLVAQLSRRADGACGPGHVTAFVDVGQLGRDLLEPRMVPGVDPRKVITTQALTSTFLTQLTALDQVFLDLAPTPTGATVFLEVKLSKRDRRE
ncbi:MAG: PKD domain-containing protein [Myxococcales bacterium]|nr:PKD domain-containing protein [Myxococcales bacterium]